MSPTMFNVVLNKIIKELWKINNSGATLCTKNNNVKIGCLAYADDVPLLSETEEEAIAQINALSEIARKTGLEISFENTELMTTDANFKKKTIETKYGTIKVSHRFKYLGEIRERMNDEDESGKT